jgi:4-hydroxy-tetrahydrodipicolinate synthase
MVAMITPFRADGRVDLEATARLVEMHKKAGTHGLIVCGTTGETPTMTNAEQEELIAFVIKEVNGSMPVIVGTGSNNTLTAVASSRRAQELGADGLLVVTPPYNKPTQEGLLHYYQSILAAVEIPVILYNVPGRTASSLQTETIAKLAEHPLVVGIKEATGNLVVGSDIVEECGDALDLLSGDDFTAMPLLALGAQGWISVTANVDPVRMVALYDAWKAGDIAKAQSLHYALMPLHRAMFWQSNPIPVKAAMSLMGYCENSLRSPLMPLQGAMLEKLRALLQTHGLVS